MTRIFRAVVIVFVICFGVAGLVVLLNPNRSASTIPPATPAAIESAVASSTSTLPSVSTDALTTTAMMTDATQAESEFQSLVTITPEDDAVNIRRGPGTDYGIVTTLANGVSAVVVGRNAAGDWLQIEQGWVNRDVVLTTGDVSQVPVVEVEPPAAKLSRTVV